MLFRSEVDRSRVLVAPYVAAAMTDLLQTAVNTGTGREAQIGRPVAGKTGTTSSQKDGWFLGFSSGLTTGVWMGRDNARPVAGLHGGTAPARAFAAFMRPATASRPIEQFDTQVTLPEWQLEPDEESYFGGPDNGSFVDENGEPLPQQPADPVPPADIGEEEPVRAAPPPRTPQQQLDDLIESVSGRDRPARDPQRRDTPAPPAAVPTPRPPQEALPNQ